MSTLVSPASTFTHSEHASEKYWNCWKLKTERGRQVWRFEPPAEFNKQGAFDETNDAGQRFLKEMSEAFRFDSSVNPNSADLVYRKQAFARSFEDFEQNGFPASNSDSLPEKAFLSAIKGLDFYKTLQAPEGHFPGDYGGPLFLLPGLIIASYITETAFPPTHRELMKRYMLNHQNDDGGWGLHIEGESTMFGTVMQYVTLRLLGANANEPEMESAREWILQNGGAVNIPPWGKFYLALLGVYDWDGCNTLMPEMWLLPKPLPFHPWRYWCHSRMIYLPMAYCYGNRVTGKITPVIESLRKELYAEEYEKIDWNEMRDKIAETDLFAQPSKALKVLNRFTNAYERFHSKYLRKKALQFILEFVNAEDEQTNYIDIGPVNQIINSVCVWHAYGKGSPQFHKHVARWQDYLWVAEDGMKLNGYNGSQLWDTAFAMQAILESDLEKFYPDVIRKAYNYLEISQVQHDVPQREKFFRHISKGGWPFSTLDHGWPISDCTAEGLSAALKTHHSGILQRHNGIPSKISNERLQDAVDVILSFQNKDGGWATYENTRGEPWLELLNPSGIFGNIMIDYSYTECTSACIRALCAFRKEYPGYRTREIDSTIKRGIDFIKKKQLPDGSWQGSWGVCFTYGTWFAVEGLIAAGENSESYCIQAACDFLVSNQNVDGGWGESFESCVQSRYVHHKESQAVNTSWALLALLAAGYPGEAVIENGINFLMKKQQANGDWKQEGISGVFNSNCMITYTAYRNIFPLWALGRYAKKYGDAINEFVKEENLLCEVNEKWMI